MYEILLWDLDDTILDFKRSEKYALEQTLKIEGIEVTDKQVAHYSRLNDYYWKKLERGEITKDTVLKQRFLTFFEEEGIRDVQMERIYQNYPHFLGSVFFYKDHSRELLLELKEQGYRQYLVTNGTKKVQISKITKAGLDQIVDGILISEEIGYHKPDIRYFEKCFRLIGETDKRKYLLIGDSVTSDILGANQAGIDCCWYHGENTAQKERIRANYEILNLKLIKEILDDDRKKEECE
ncbi:MAG TPA: YjjG family noncanonical pyrimidine nucleotidase [Lachnospiraceae bacterium]|nr:YjjG family noncanonical pyrimidine nucleotidase [Lachnospiraceae bacterium]HPF29739.1 YjjG family noncanonical pyrimidine nucleotidase [Lachnospiraceae bacterium]